MLLFYGSSQLFDEVQRFLQLANQLTNALSALDHPRDLILREAQLLRQNVKQWRLICFEKRFVLLKRP